MRVPADCFRKHSRGVKGLMLTWVSKGESVEEARKLLETAPTLGARRGGCAILGNFLLVPNLSSYLQINMGFPREHMPVPAEF